MSEQTLENMWRHLVSIIGVNVMTGVLLYAGAGARGLGGLAKVSHRREKHGSPRHGFVETRAVR